MFVYVFIFVASLFWVYQQEVHTSVSLWLQTMSPAWDGLTSGMFVQLERVEKKMWLAAATFRFTLAEGLIIDFKEDDFSVSCCYVAVTVWAVQTAAGKYWARRQT